MDKLEIDIVQEIGGWGFNLQTLSSQVKGKDVDEIHIPINSFGGSVVEGLAAYQYIKALSPRTQSNIIGYAMSMGTVVALAADHVTMPRNAYFMIHEPWGVGVGDSEDMESTAQILESMADQLADIYAEHSNLTKDQIRAMMKAETWMTGEEALAHGFIDELTDVAQIQASFDTSKYRNTPNALIMSNDKKSFLAKAREFFAANPEVDSVDDVVAANTALKADNEALKAKLSTAEQSETTLKAEKSQFEKDLQAANAKITTLEADKVGLEAKVTELSAQPAASHTDPGGSTGEGSESDDSEYKAWCLTERNAKWWAGLSQEEKDKYKK